MAEPGEVLDYLDQADSWPAELELVDRLDGSLQVEEPVQVLHNLHWDRRMCTVLAEELDFGPDSLV